MGRITGTLRSPTHVGVEQVYISAAEVDVDTAYLGVPLMRQVTMVNLSNLEVIHYTHIDEEKEVTLGPNRTHIAEASTSGSHACRVLLTRLV